MEERLRICIVALMYAPIVGGAEARAEKYARQLLALGHDVTVVTLRHGKHWRDAETINGVNVLRVGGIYKSDGTLRIGRLGHIPPDILIFRQLWRLRNNFDLFYCVQMSPLTAVAALIGKLTHKPVIISIPSTPFNIKIDKDHTSLMADTLTNADYLKVPFHDTLVGNVLAMTKTAVGGKQMLDFLRNSEAYFQILSSRSYSYLTDHGFKGDRIVHISGGVDTEKFQPNASRRPDPAKPERDIICVARLEYPKGIDVLLHAWSRMMKEPDEWRTNLKPRLLIVGTGALEQQLQRMADDLGLQESVKFLGLHRDVILLLQQAWGFVLPSRWEGLPNALIEAMSCGLPCVATRVSGSEDIIQDGVNGLLVESEQPAKMAQALQRIIADTELAQRLGQEGRTTVLRDYQLRHVTEQTITLYRHILNHNTQPLPFALKGTANER